MGKPRSILLDRLKELGYEAYWWIEPPSRPDYASERFRDILPCLDRLEIGDKKLYRHQLEAFNALLDGKNIVLTAKTGSGKTEAWALAALKSRWKVLAIYPTLALSADQIKRLERYYEACGYGDNAVARIDRPSITRPIDARLTALRAKVIVTNPAFLLADLKRYAVSHSRSILAEALREVDLIVVDELDFYGPRGANLILAMIELISNYIARDRPRIAVLSATLGNPDELARYLSEVTGRETVRIEGKPFKAQNITIVVLGKNAEILRDYVLAHSDVIAKRAKWILDIVEDEREFREHLYEVYEALEALGLRPPRPSLDVTEILSEIVKLPGNDVTLVFTRSVKSAERLYRSLLEQLPKSLHSKVAVHHHLVSKRERERIEEEARRGRIRVVITVRTLAQGIDIGTVTRVVHVGLPIDLREFLQREGRKGRREDIELAETLIIPSGLWDRRLLEAGSSTLRDWLSLPLEKLYINPRNAYSRLFKILWKILAGVSLDKDEAKLVTSMGLAHETTVTLSGEVRLELTEKGYRLWNEIGFYEHGPPYGFRKIVVTRFTQKVGEEEISQRDVVEHYQPGFYDPMSEMVVVSVDVKRRRVFVEELAQAVEEYDWLAEAAARYEDIKRRWGEKPSLEDDFRYGRVQATVELKVMAPLKGFGELVEEPVMVKWIVESRRPRLSRGRGAVRVYRETAVIELNAPVAGRYRDLTYGLAAELPAYIDGVTASLGVAALIVALRMHPRYALPLNLVRYSILTTPVTRLLHLWEYEAAGILENMNWLEVSKAIGELKPTPLMAVLIAAIDPDNGLKILSGEVGLDKALAAARAVAEAIAASTMRVIERGGKRLLLPKRSRRHGIASLVVLIARKNGEYVVVADVFDGEEHSVEEIPAGRMGFAEASEVAQKLAILLDKYVKSYNHIYYYGREQYTLLRRLLTGSFLGNILLNELERKGVLRDAAAVAQKTGLQSLAAILGLERLYKIASSMEDENIIELEKARSLVKEVAEAVYDLALAAEKGASQATSEDRTSSNSTRGGSSSD